jgi:hypothetical protein
MPALAFTSLHPFPLGHLTTRSPKSSSACYCVPGTLRLHLPMFSFVTSLLVCLQADTYKRFQETFSLNGESSGSHGRERDDVLFILGRGFTNDRFSSPTSAPQFASLLKTSKHWN